LRRRSTPPRTSTKPSLRDEPGRVVERNESVQDGTTLVTAGYAHAYDVSGRLAQVSVNGNQTDEFIYADGGNAANGNRIEHVSSAGTVRGRYDSQDRMMRYCPEDDAGNPTPIASVFRLLVPTIRRPADEDRPCELGRDRV